MASPEGVHTRDFLIVMPPVTLLIMPQIRPLFSAATGISCLLPIPESGLSRHQETTTRCPAFSSGKMFWGFLELLELRQVADLTEVPFTRWSEQAQDGEGAVSPSTSFEHRLLFGCRRLPTRLIFFTPQRETDRKRRPTSLLQFCTHYGPVKL